LVTVIGSFAARAEEPAAAAAEPVSFKKQIAPLLLKNCEACHNAREAKGGFQVSTFELLGKPGDSESAPFTPGKPDESEILTLIATDDPDSRMPKDGDPLPAAQVELVKRWITEGAKFDAPDPKVPLASLVPKASQPDPPVAYRRPLPITAVSFSPDGQELAVGGYHEVTLWNAASGVLLRRIHNVAERTYGVSYNNDGSLLAVAGGTPGQTGEVKLFNPVKAELVRELGSMSDVAFHARFNPAGTKLAACGADRAIRIFDVASGKEEKLIEDHADWVVDIAWNPDGSRLASASRDKTSKVFNAASGDSLTTYTGHGEQVFGVAFSGDGKQVLTAGGDRKIHAWDPEDSKKTGEAGGFSREVFTVVNQGGQVFGASADRNLRQFKDGKLEFVRNYAGSSDAVYCASYHPGSKRLAAGTFAGDVRVWNTENGSLVVTFFAAPGYVPPAATASAAK